MYNPNNYLAQVMETFFVCSFVATWLCLYFRRYCMIIKGSIESLHRVSNPWVELHIARAPSIILL